MWKKFFYFSPTTTNVSFIMFYLSFSHQLWQLTFVKCVNSTTKCPIQVSNQDFEKKFTFFFFQYWSLIVDSLSSKLLI